ncbi:MAG: hypothetical protein ABGW98_08720, partial [Myxococcales bacterium]
MSGPNSPSTRGGVLAVTGIAPCMWVVGGWFGGMVRSEEWTIPREASTTRAIEILNLRIYFRAHPAG